MSRPNSRPGSPIKSGRDRHAADLLALQGFQKKTQQITPIVKIGTPIKAEEQMSASPTNVNIQPNDDGCLSCLRSSDSPLCLEYCTKHIPFIGKPCPLDPCHLGMWVFRTASSIVFNAIRYVLLPPVWCCISLNPEATAKPIDVTTDVAHCCMFNCGKLSLMNPNKSSDGSRR
eukprot:GILI01023004.1.p1 GENE.GILI01023004.1~~GILI01023004.1.p1  ORF type:complete len:173 (+),score=4.90 GILI01023004.1:94-612(+)